MSTEDITYEMRKYFNDMIFQARESLPFLRPYISHNLYRKNRILDFSKRKYNILKIMVTHTVCATTRLSGNKELKTVIYKHGAWSALNTWNYKLHKPVIFI